MDYYEPLCYLVGAMEHGWKLRTVLQTRMHVSRQLLVRLKQTERGILVNGERKYADFHVSDGDVIELRMEQEQSEDILPQPMELDIVHEDDQLLIVNKPVGLIVHPTHGHYLNTLANGVVHWWLACGVRHRFRPVQRLDQETSGLICIAKTPYAHQFIAEQLVGRLVKKEYLAIVDGVIDVDDGEVDGPIDRLPDEPHRRAVLAGGAQALTKYQVIERFRTATLIRLGLKSGRTHQIRVHMEHLGHPLLGDRLYGLPRRAEPVAQPGAGAPDSRLPSIEPPIGQAPRHWRWIERHALHAETLGFVHPGSKSYIEWRQPLPADMQQCLRLAREEL